MSKYASLSDVKGLAAPAGPAAPAAPNSFEQGLRQGLTATGGQLNALAGGVAEAVGAKDFAAAQYARAREAEALAATQAPAVSDWRQVTEAPDLGTGLRNAGSYIAGLAGQSVPALGAGLGAAALAGVTRGGVAAPMIAGTAAVAPLEVGGALQRQQADPAMLENDAATRLQTAAVEGTARAGLSMAVPLAMGGKLLGKGLSPMTMGQAVTRNVAEGVAGNAAAGAAAEQVSTVAMDSLNADRDRSGDDARMMDAAVAGAALGVPFAGAGIAAHAVRGPRPAPRTDGVPLDGAPPVAAEPVAKPTLVDRFRNWRQRDEAATELATVQKIADGHEIVDAETLRAAAPERQRVILDESDAQRQSTVEGWFNKLSADETLDDGTRAKLGEAGTDLGNRANQSIVAGIKMAQDVGSKAVAAAADFFKLVSKDKGDAGGTPPEGVKLSSMSTKADEQIARIVAPKLAKQFPQLVANEQAMKAVTGGLRRVMTELRETGQIDPGVAKHLNNWFGKKTPDVLAGLHDTVLDRSDTEATARFFSALTRMTDENDARTSLHTKLKEALPEDMRDVDDEQLGQLTTHLREYVRGDYAKDVPAERAAFERRQIEESLREHFGDKTEDVIGLFENEKQAKGDALDEGMDDHDYALSDETGFADGQEFGATTERDVQARYYGGGKDKHAPQFVMSEQAHRRIYNNDSSQAARLLAAARAENPDMNVRAVSAHEYAQRHEIPKARLLEMTGGAPDDHVMIVAEGFNNKDGLTWQQVDKLRLDTHKYPDSKSRVETEGNTLDAKRMMEMYRPEHMLPRNETDAISPFHRMRRQMTEAIAALSDHTGEAIHVPDDAIVGKVGGKMVTWGEVQAKSKMDAGPSAKLGAAREQAVKAGDTEGVAEIDAVMDEKILAENDPGNELATGLPERTLHDRKAAISKFMAKTSEELRVASEEAGPRPDPADLRRQALAVEDMVDRMEAEHKRGAATTGQPDMLHPMEREMWIERADRLRELADTLEASGGKRWLTMKERAAWRKLDEVEKRYLKLERDITAERKPTTAFAHDKDMRGMSDTPVDGNIHAAAREHGDELGGKFAASRNMEAGPENNMLHADNFHQPMRPNKAGENVANFDGQIPAAQRSAIGTKIAAMSTMQSNGKMHLPAQRVAARARELFNLMQNGGMRVMDQAMFASIIKDKSVSSIAETVNDLHAKYAARLAQQPTKASAFVERVVGKGDVSAVIKSIKASDDMVTLRRVVDALAPHQHDASARTVLEVANERLGKLLEADPDAAYSMQRVNAATHQSGKPLADVQTHIETVLGKTVDVEFNKMLHAGEFRRIPGRKAMAMNEDVIRISVHAFDPMGTAYHESLHAFFRKLRDAGLMTELHPLLRAADSVPVKMRLQELLANEPAALAQLKDAEERVAYMYQFWAKGDLVLPAKPAGIMGVIAGFLRRVLGIWTNDQRAVQIMEYFQSGEYAKEMKSADLVRERLQVGTNRALEQFKEMARPLTRLGEAVLATGDGRLRGSMIPALIELADNVYAPLQGDAGGKDPGYMPAARIKRGEVMNMLAKDLARFEVAQVTDALAAMQRGEKGSTTAEKAIVATVRKVLDDMHVYMTEAGVKVGDMGLGKDYFPRVWDPELIIKNEAAFRAMLGRYQTMGVFSGRVDEVVAVLTRTDGSELQTQTIKPGMQFTKKRVLDFVSALDAAPFVQKDAYRTINSYVTQATRRAEWSRRFGDDSAGLHELFSRAKKEGATPEQIQTASDYLQGVDGTLGDSMNPKLRRLFGNMIVYQNVRLLPLAIFSSLIDPGGIVVRGGTVGDAFRAMKRGFAEIPKGFKKGVPNDAATDLATQLGIIDDAVLQQAIGTSYSQGMTSDMGRKINDTFFKYNLMEQFNRSMRVAATEAAAGFLQRHADGTASPHSKRWLAELGFKPNEIVVKNGRMLIHAHEFEAHGMKPDDAAAMADRMTLAMNRWVDGAVLRPNSAHKPVWMNDPRFALVSHLKQFVYAFQETILKRVANEVRFGNVGPAYALASYVPFMIAADVLKGALVSGGGVPDGKEGWDLADYIWNGVQRAGLFGVGQFGLDVAKDVRQGGAGIGALAGPMVEQLGDAVSVVGGPQQFETFALNALPANAVLDGAGEMLRGD